MAALDLLPVRRGPAMAAALMALLLAALLASPAAAQEEAVDPEEKKDPYGSGMGLEVVLSNNGFGLGGYYSRALDESTSFLLETSLGAGKDEREVKFFSFGRRSYVPDKANYLLMLPVQAGITRRLFQESIEENFRPYLQITGGPTLGWEYPYFSDNNGNAVYEPDDGEQTYDAFTGFFKGHPRFGLGGTLALGAYFGLSEKVTQGVRVGYAFTYFFQGIQLLESDVAAAQRFFHTPTISITFGKLF